MAEALRLSRSSQLSVVIEVQCFLSDDDGGVCASDSLPVSQTSSNPDTAAGAAGAAFGADSSTITSICSLEDCSKTVLTERKWMRALKRIRRLQTSKASNSSAPLQASNRDSNACSNASKLSSSLYKGQETTPKALASRCRSSYAQSCSWAAGAARSLKHSSRCLLSSCLTPHTKEQDDSWPPQLQENRQLKQHDPVQQDEPTTAAGTPVNTAADTVADPLSDAPLHTTAGITIQAQQAADVPEPVSAAALASTTATSASAPSVITPAAGAVADESAPAVSCTAAEPDSISVEGKVASDDKVEVVGASYETARATQVCKACHLNIIPSGQLSTPHLHAHSVTLSKPLAAELPALLGSQPTTRHNALLVKPGPTELSQQQCHSE